MNESPLFISLPSDPENVKEVQPYVDKILQQFDVNNDLYGNILISLTEAVTNAIIHGNQADDSKKVLVNTKILNNQISFRVTDEGPGFDFDHLPDPTAPENLLELSGRGVFLMKQLSDDLAFHDNGSTVEIKFTLN